MRILVEILHPAHVHFFRNAIAEWTARGDDILVLSREKECANDLLEAYDIPYTSISKLGQCKGALLFEMAVRDVRMLRHALRFKPDVLTGIMGVTIAQVGRLIRKPAVVFYDTENATLTNRIVYPLAHAVCTPDCYQGEVRGTHITYPGYHELAYLHPDRFTPDPDIVRRAGVEPHAPYFIVRFVSWQASHDVGEKGLPASFKQEVIESLQPHGRVLVTSEGPLPPALEQYRLRMPPQDMHHLIACASMLVGESATMASEAAVLGVPAIFISDTGRGYTDEEDERYGLVRCFTTREQASALQTIRDMLAEPNRGKVYAQRREKLLEDKIDTTGWMINYLDRVAVTKENTA